MHFVLTGKSVKFAHSWTIRQIEFVKFFLSAGRLCDTHLGHHGGRVDALVVLPAVQAALGRHVCQVNIHARQQVPLREAHHVLQPVPGALAGRQAASGALLRRDAAVPPRSAHVGVRRDEAAVLRRVGQKHDGETDVAGGDAAQAEEEEHLLLEASPLAQERGGAFEVAHAARGGRTGGDVGLGILTAVSSHPPQINSSLKAQPHFRCGLQASKR